MTITKKTKRGQPKYPWRRWFSMKRVKIEQGKQYHCKPYSMLIQIRQAATRHGLTVHIYVSGKHAEKFIMVIDKPLPKPKPKGK